MFEEFDNSQYFELILNSINSIVVSCDVNGDINYMSPAVEKILGYKSDALFGDSWWELVYSNSDEIRSVKDKIRKILSGNIPIDHKPYDIEIECKDGDYKWIEWRDSLGGDKAYIFVGVDVSEWKKTVGEKLQSDTILDNLTSMVLVGDVDNNIIYASPSVEEVIGYPITDLMGEKWWEVTYSNKNDALKVKESIYKYVFHGEIDFIDITKQKIKTSTGDFKWIEWQISKGVNNTYVSIGIDITQRILKDIELQKAKEAAENSLKIKNQFLANMSHEIRTPLNAVVGFTDLLLETKLTSEQREHLKTMQNSGEILLSLINNVLDLSKLESKRFEIEEIPFDLYKCLNGVVKLLKLKANQKGISLDIKIDTNTPKQVIGDPTRLEQIFLNLIGNAIKFTNDGSVVVTVKQIKEASGTSRIYFEIKDTGIGIVSNKVNSIFGAFTQAKDDTSRIYGGTGLGLAIVKKLVNLLEGQIEVESVFGKGSVFKLELPFKKGSTYINKEETEQVVSMREPLNLNILVVEDNKTNQLLVKTRLERWKCAVDIANNGLEGVKRVQQKLYDIILMDIQMPIMDGYEATKIIKNDISEKAALVPIIAMTAYATNADIKRARNAGVDDYIYKPFKPDKLYKLLRKYGKVAKITALEEVNRPKVKPVLNESVQKLVDLTFLRKETLNEGVILKMLIELFIKDFDEFIAVTDQELKNKNWDILHKATHKIKPSITMFGIDKMKQIIYSLESNFREEKELDSVVEQVSKCKKMFEGVRKELVIEMNSLNNEG